MKNHFEISIIFRCIITLIRLNEKNLCCSFISRIWMLFESIIFHRREKNLKHNIEERFCYMSLLLSRATDSCARRILLLIRLCTTQIEVIQIHAKVLHHPSECWEWYIINYLIENRDLLDIINNNQIITTQRFNSYQLIMLFSLALWKYAGIGKCGGGWKWNVKIVSTFSFAHTPIHTHTQRFDRLGLTRCVPDFVIPLCSLENWITIFTSLSSCRCRSIFRECNVKYGNSFFSPVAFQWAQFLFVWMLSEFFFPPGANISEPDSFDIMWTHFLSKPGLWRR